MPQDGHGGELRGIADEVVSLFSAAKRALENGDEPLAAQVLDGYQSVNQRCEKLIDEIMQDESLSTASGVSIALAARFLKRIGAHLSNLASSVVNPFDRIGFRPGDGAPVDPEDSPS